MEICLNSNTYWNILPYSSFLKLQLQKKNLTICCSQCLEKYNKFEFWCSKTPQSLLLTLSVSDWNGTLYRPIFHYMCQHSDRINGNKSTFSYMCQHSDGINGNKFILSYMCQHSGHINGNKSIFSYMCQHSDSINGGWQQRVSGR